MDYFVIDVSEFLELFLKKLGNTKTKIYKFSTFQKASFWHH